MKPSLIAPLVALSCMLSACFQNTTTIHIQKNGSGAITEETRIGKSMLQMFESMAGMNAKKDKPADIIQQLFSDDIVQKRAKMLGEGVTVTQIEPITNSESKGAKITYAFKDINLVKISPTQNQPNQTNLEESASDPISFKLENDILTVSIPQKTKASADSAPKPDMDLNSPEMDNMMKQMMADMKISIKIVCDSGIAKTNASHSSLNTVSLVDIDMNRVLKNDAAFKQLKKIKQNDPIKALESLNHVDGVQIETKPEIQITLK
jgi:hypothetical protein